MNTEAVPGAGPVDEPVGPAEWERLKRYGYAPGNYLKTCCLCGMTAKNMDKRAICCKRCAELKHAARERGKRAPGYTLDQLRAMNLPNYYGAGE